MFLFSLVLFYLCVRACVKGFCAVRRVRGLGFRVRACVKGFCVLRRRVRGGLG